MIMKKILFVLSAMLLAVSVWAQKERRSVSSFDEVQVSQAIDLYLKKGTKESVEVEVSGIDMDEVITEVRGGRLKVYLSGNWYRNHSVKVYVTFVNLEEISASSASTVYGEGVIKGERLEIGVSSAADVEVEVDVNELTTSASSSGDIDLKGKAKFLEVSVSSAGGVDAYDLEAKVVHVRASSGASAKVNATDEIDAHASSGASIRYTGDPTKSSTDSSSGGSVRKSN